MFVSTATQALFPVSRTPVSRPVDHAASFELLFAGKKDKEKKKAAKAAAQAPEKAVEATAKTTLTNSQTAALATPLTEDKWEKQEAQEQPVATKEAVLAQSGTLATETDAAEETGQTDAVEEVKRAESPVQPTVQAKDESEAAKASAKPQPSSPKVLAQEKTKALDADLSASAEEIHEFSDSGEEIEPLTKEEKLQAAKEHEERKRRRHGEKMETPARVYEYLENTAKSSTRHAVGGFNTLVTTFQDAAISTASSGLKTVASKLSETATQLDKRQYKK